MLGGASKKVIVIEIEVDHFSVPIDRDAGNIVPKVAIPIDAKLILVLDHVAAVAKKFGLRILARRFLIDSIRIDAHWSALISVPKALHQCHEKETVNPMPFFDRLIAQFRDVRVEVNSANQFSHGLLPILAKRRMFIDAGGHRWRGWCRPRAARAARKRARTAGETRRCHDEVASIDLITIAHRITPRSIDRTGMQNETGPIPTRLDGSDAATG